MALLTDVSFNGLELAPPYGIGSTEPFGTLVTGIAATVTQVIVFANGSYRVTIAPNAPIYGIPVAFQGKEVSAFVFYTGTALKVGQAVMFDLQGNAFGILVPTNVNI